MEGKWKVGDRVNWKYVIAPGSFTYVPGVVMKITARRISIEVVFRIRGETLREKRSVNPESLLARFQHVQELDS